ncbi:Tetratricopeptide repeat (TPR)-like superfamily protein [Melia azedarach]|uniref:Tetratricopeptide repeat (TPR)-like superfamily protein n=1 Tax=Melia azedarach TaxID=155640 RepID=A0ACC1X0F6_MELAZ|nr:Tetratricopeptide repeat (TPR)-like superfamily protein [Melia azedarach]
MTRTVLKLSRLATNVSRTNRCPGPTFGGPCLFSALPQSRLVHDGNKSNGLNSSPVVLQMINYALSHVRAQKSDESYGQGMLVLEQCLYTQPSDGQCGESWRGIALLAMSTLLYERGNYMDAIEKLQKVEDFKNSYLGVRVAAMEALAGLNLQLGQDDTSSVVADKCLELWERYKPKSDEEYGALVYRVNAVKGLVELTRGNLESAEAFFEGFQENEGCTGNAAVSYGEYLHVTRNFLLAKKFYQKVIEVLAEQKDFSDMNALGSCNMTLEEVSLAATFALGQLEAHIGNFGDAEEILTRALTKTEELYGSHHPKVGVVLTCLALMFRNKAVQERSSALLIQEGLYRRALEFLKAPPMESEGAEAKVDRTDIAALARGGYAEALCVQQNRKDEGERMKRWAEAAWRNRRVSLAEALSFSEPVNKVLVIDARISRAI